jgi:hypothetical protein
MSVDAFPILLVDELAMSVFCRNSLTDAQVRAAQAALRGLDPAWSLDCCESCEADWFLDLSSVRPDGRVVSFIIHARDSAIHVLRMVDDDDHSRLGRFDDMAQAIGAVVEAIKLGPG